MIVTLSALLLQLASITSGWGSRLVLFEQEFTICNALCDLVSFSQFIKTWKTRLCSKTYKWEYHYDKFEIYRDFFFILKATKKLFPRADITNFSPLFHFYTPWKCQKSFGFLTFSRGLDMYIGLKWAKELSRVSSSLPSIFTKALLHINSTIFLTPIKYQFLGVNDQENCGCGNVM